MMLLSTISFYTYAVFYVDEEGRKDMINTIAGQKTSFPYSVIATILVDETKKCYMPSLLRKYLLFPYFSLYLCNCNRSSFYIMIAYIFHDEDMG